MRALVTGNLGMLGTEVSELLGADSSVELTAIDRDELDITDAAAVSECITTLRPDLVVNCAAYTAVDNCETDADAAQLLNATAVRNLAEAIARTDGHLVHVSTDYVFDGTKPTPYNEWDDCNPQSVYGATKRAGEIEAFAALGEACTVARTSWLCGRYGNNMVKTVMRVAAQPGRLSFVDDQRGHPTFADDLARMLVLLGAERRPGIFHVTNAGAVSWYEYVQEILAAIGDDPSRVDAIHTADLQPPRPAPRPANSVLENLALRLAGIEPLGDHREALARCVQQLRA